MGINDVAALAGVSPGTVSNTLNHPDRVAPATRERVTAAIEALSFVPHGPARSLAVGSMQALGLVVSDLSNSLFVDVARGVEEYAGRHGAMVLMANSDTDLDREQQYLAAFEAAQTLGLLVTINDASHFEAISARPHGSRPLVFLNFRGDGRGRCSVHMDNRLGGRLAARHLVETGRRRLALVGGPSHLQPVAERCEGFADELRSTGAQLVVRRDVEQLHRADGWRVGLELLPLVESGEIDGIFAVADLVASGIAQAIAPSASVSIPDDLGIVGYDDNRAAWDSPLPLTTVRQPGAEMGAAGAGLVFEEIASAEHEHTVVELHPELVVRRSTVAAP
ncbi:MAG: LacI family transcriptional regulator [Actinomycetales bacterium]|nr:LacI family transcriptional regulator [Actinomycetales bacterium]